MIDITSIASSPRSPPATPSTANLGAGGVATVYLARDIKHDWKAWQRQILTPPA